jgi:CPA2 family monovalent cation:H+ antiporter-2
MTQLQAFRLLSAQQVGVVLAAVFFSMLLAPLLLRGAPRLAERLRKRHTHSSSQDEIKSAAGQLQQHVLICGYGRVGQSIARFLRLENIPFLALDDDPVRVQEAAAGEAQVHYGDSRRIDLLQAMNIHCASLLVVAVDNAEIALRIVENVRRINSDIPILVRLRDDSRLSELQAAGATEVVPEVLESSLMLASHAMALLGLPARRIQAHVDEVREGRYRLLHAFYHGGQLNLLTPQGEQRDLLHAVTLSSSAAACGKRMAELDFSDLNIEVRAVQRGDKDLTLTDSMLQEGDTLLLCGPLGAIETAEARLLARGYRR